MQKGHRTALGYSCVPVNHHVFAQSLLVRLVTEERQRNSRIASNVLDFLVKSSMGQHEFLAFESDPHYGDLW